MRMINFNYKCRACGEIFTATLERKALLLDSEPFDLLVFVSHNYVMFAAHDVNKAGCPCSGLGDLISGFDYEKEAHDA